MPLVIAAFETLSQAEAAARSTLEAGYAAGAVRAAARSGGGRLLLADRVAVQTVGRPAKLADRAERAGSAALAGAVAGALLAVVAAVALRAMRIDPLAAWRGYVAGPLLVFTAALLCAALGAAISAAALRSSGLPHNLALRYAHRLESGDVVLGVRTDNARQARSVQESFTIHGATLAHVTHGELESLAPESLNGAGETTEPPLG